MQAIKARRVWWIGLGSAALLVAGCGATEPGSPQAGDLPVTATTSSVSPSTTMPTTTSSTESATESETPPTSETATAPPETSTSSAPESTTNGGGSDECPDTSAWDTADKQADLAGNGPIAEIGAETGSCVDSFVITLRPGAHEPGYLVRYVDAIIQDGSGFPVPVDGNGKLEVIVDSPAYDPDTGQSTLQIPDHDHAVDVSGFAVIKQIAFAGSFEGQTTFGIGLSSELPFSVTAAQGSDGRMTLTVAIAHE